MFIIKTETQKVNVSFYDMCRILYDYKFYSCDMSYQLFNTEWFGNNDDKPIILKFITTDNTKSKLNIISSANSIYN